MWSAPPNRILGHPQQLPIGLEMASQSAGLVPLQTLLQGGGGQISAKNRGRPYPPKCLI